MPMPPEGWVPTAEEIEEIQNLSEFVGFTPRPIPSRSGQINSRTISFTTRDQPAVTDAISKKLHKIVETETKMTSAYPMTIEAFSLNHKGGTKSYHGKLIRTNDDKSLAIFRFGKTGVFGQLKIVPFSTVAEGNAAYEKKISAKMSGGYKINPRFDHTVSTIDTRTDLLKELGRPTMAKMGAHNLHHIDPDANTKGMRDVEDPHLTEDGALDPTTIAKRKREENEAKAAAREVIQKSQEKQMNEAYSDNPTWGAF